MLGPIIYPKLLAENIKLNPTARLESSAMSEITDFVITIKPNKSL